MSGLSVGALLPDATLISATGQPVRISDHRGRYALVLLLLGELRDAALRERLLALADRYAEIRQEGAEVLAIVPGPREAAEALARARPFPFPILADVDKRAHRQYEAVERGMLLIADRYGEIYFVGAAAEGHSLLSVEEILSWIRFTEAQCPE